MAEMPKGGFTMTSRSHTSGKYLASVCVCRPDQAPGGGGS